MTDRRSDPGSLQAATDAPTPEPQTSTPRSARPREWPRRSRAPCRDSRSAPHSNRCRGRPPRDPGPTALRACVRAASRLCGRTRPRPSLPRYVTANDERRVRWRGRSSGGNWDSSCGPTLCARARRLAPDIRRRPCRPRTSQQSSSQLTSATTTTSRDSPANDQLVFSKGHASPLVYGIFRAAGVAVRGGVPDLPPVRLSTRGPSDPCAAVGRRRHRLARPGPADRRRHGARRQASRPAPVPHLGDLRRQRDGRGLDVGGLRARRALRARQPHRRSST